MIKELAPNTLDEKLTLLDADKHAYFMALALQERNIPWKVLEKPGEYTQAGNPMRWLCFFINDRALQYRMSIFSEPEFGEWGSPGKQVNHAAQLIVADKHATKQRLMANDISCPKGAKFRRRHLKHALDYFNSTSGKLCVKPNNGNRGRGVTSGINSYQQYKTAIETVAADFVNIVVEEHVEGDHFRFFYVEPEVVGVRQGVPLSVTGDGESSISQLLNVKNIERRKRALPTHPEVNMDEGIIRYLDAQNLNPESVIPAGAQVFLRSSAGYPEGADTILLGSKDVHQDYLDVVKAACQAIPGLHFSGVDLVIKDITQPATKDNYWILEVNSTPAFIPFYYPWKGETVDIAGCIIDMMLKRFPFLTSQTKFSK